MLMRAERSKPVLLFACFVGLLILLSAYCTHRDGSTDELGFLNPPYMLAHFGKLTFPTYPHNMFFDLPVITHPPVHLTWIGLLWRAGFSIYYAEATPTVLLFLLSLVIIVRSAFPVAVKLGWLFSIGFLASTGDRLTLCFGMRPEGELQAAWFCGLLLLESGRLANWDRFRLCAGAFFLTYASGLHYYAYPAFTGVAVYWLWAVRSLGWQAAKPRVIALSAGVGLFALPYAALYLLPHFTVIYSTIRANQGLGGMGVSIGKHLAIYRYWSQDTYDYFPALIRRAMAPGIPLLVYSTAILAAVRSTRGIALAALPLQLALFLFASHKMFFYMVHESVLFAAAVSIGLLALIDYLVTRWRRQKLERSFAPVAAAGLAVWLVTGSPMLADARVSFHPRVHEVEVAHAAGRRILGPHARVGGRWMEWYSSGAEHWYDIEHDLLSSFLYFDLPTYLRNLDAIADCATFGEPDRIAAWYADGTLKLRGFYFAQTNEEMRYVLLSSQPAAPLTGYAMGNGQLFRFQENTEGSYEVLSAVCPAAVGGWYEPRNGVFSTSFFLPESAGEPSRWLVTVLAPRSYMAPAGPVGRSCREVSRVRGTLLFEDWKALVAWSRQTDPPMHFYHNLGEMPGYTGVGLPPEAAPPPDTVRVEKVIDLEAIEGINRGRVEHVPQVRVTTIRAIGGFSAMIPVTNAESVTTPCWVVLTLRVRAGRVGFAVFNTRTGLIARTKAIAAAPEPQTVALPVPDFRAATDIIVFNESIVGGQADILDAAILVARKDAGRKP
jgi:hypothetical protein